MTTPGLDEAWQRASIPALDAGGYRFVCRYLSYDNTGKNLTADEAQALSAAGIAIVSNWEYAATAAQRGHDQGTKDATEADVQHVACGGPSDRPVYFSADFDIPDYAPTLSNDPVNALAKLGPVAEYYGAINDVIGRARTGAYGGYWAIKRLFDANLISWGWQTYAWSGDGQGGTLWDSRAQIRQVHNGVLVGGANVDLDQAQVPDFGQWMTPGIVLVAQPLPPAPPPVSMLIVDGQLGPLTTRRWQQMMGTVVDGYISQPPDHSSLVAAVQRRLNAAIGAGLVVDGQGICQDGHTVYRTTRALQRYLNTSQDGVLSLPTSECVAALQRRLNAGRF